MTEVDTSASGCVHDFAHLRMGIVKPENQREIGEKFMQTMRERDALKAENDRLREALKIAMPILAACCDETSSASIDAEAALAHCDAALTWALLTAQLEDLNYLRVDPVSGAEVREARGEGGDA